LGKFRDLLGATAHHPAMLVYLDNVQNAAPGSKGLNGREAGINENYARELMELHTLGADGGYTQDDVVALSRILTGWSLVRPNALPERGSGFRFYPARHDNGDKHFLGHDIAGNGEAEGEAALDLLAKSPATARHLAAKLAQYFVADQPPSALVDRLAARFTETDGDIKSVLQALFASREFRDSTGAKYKSPYRFVLAAVRAAGVTVDNPKPLLGAMARLGQPLYRCATPDGYRDTEAAWLSPDASLLRVNFATALASGKLPIAEGAEPVSAASRPTFGIAKPSAEEGDLPLDEHFGLHPSLAGLLPFWQAKQLAFVHAAGSPDPTRSHFDAQLFIESGTPGRRGTPDGWMNRLLAALPNASRGPTEALAVGPTVPQILKGRMPVANLSLGPAAATPLAIDKPEVASAFDRLYAGKDAI